MCCHVDDEFLTGNNENELTKFKNYLANRFKKITDIGSFEDYVGLKIDTVIDQHGCSRSFVSLEHMIDDFSKEFAINGEIVLNDNLPISPNLKWNDSKLIEENNLKSKLLEPIWNKTGVIGYIAGHTRPDIACAASLLSKYAKNPEQVHVDMCNNVLHYFLTHRS
jgi:hypothetical protein